MTTINYINLAIQTWGCLTSLILIISILLNHNKITKINKIYLIMLISNSLVMIFDAIALYTRGKEGSFNYWGVRIGNFFAYVSNYILLAAFIAYVTQIINIHTSLSKIPLYIGTSFCTLLFLLTIINQFYPIFYYIDSNNMYHRAYLFWLNQLVGIACILLCCAYMLIKYNSFLSNSERISLWTYITLPVVALIFQILFYGIVFLNLSTIISLIIVYLLIERDMNLKIIKQEKILTENKITIMMSQIHPHFIFNSLNAIYYLCESDPHMAQEAISNFSNYLRNNIDSVNYNEPVPFKKELEFIKTYLALEKMRFDELLKVEYDIKTTSFNVPTLTIQPIVENAVKHGVGKKVDGGTVKISTREDECFYIIIISDDGVGYNPSEKPNDGKTHVGIQNVASRLKIMINGSLEIKSEKGKGTTAKINIPKIRSNI